MVSLVWDIDLGKLFVNTGIRKIWKPENIKIHNYSHSPSRACEGMFVKLDSQDCNQTKNVLPQNLISKYCADVFVFVFVLVLVLDSIR